MPSHISFLRCRRLNGSGRQPLKLETAGSNPAGITKALYHNGLCVSVLNRGERLATQQGTIWLLSSVVEHPAVNRSGAGSNPAGAAILGYSQEVRQPALTRSPLVQIQLPQPHAPMDKRPKSTAFHVGVAGSNPAGSTTCVSKRRAIFLLSSVGRARGC